MKKKIQKQQSISRGRMYVQASFNNTLITVTDETGNVIASSSAGTKGFKGARKATPYAGQIAAKEVIQKGKAAGLGSIEVLVSGVGSGRDAAIRALQGSGLEILSLKDITPVPHNGCRRKKPRRV